MTISLKDALTGFSTSIPHLDGHVVDIDTHGSIIRYGEVRTYKDEGMPVHNFPSQFGNLLVEFIVDFPRQLTENQIQQLKSVLP